MITPVENLVLSTNREKILKKIYKRKAVEFCSDEEHKFLTYYSLAEVKNGIYVITEKGIQYLLVHKKDNFRFWFPSVISVIALILSVIAILN